MVWNGSIPGTPGPAPGACPAPASRSTLAAGTCCAAVDGPGAQQRHRPACRRPATPVPVRLSGCCTSRHRARATAAPPGSTGKSGPSRESGPRVGVDRPAEMTIAEPIRSARRTATAPPCAAVYATQSTARTAVADRRRRGKRHPPRSTVTGRTPGSGSSNPPYGYRHGPANHPWPAPRRRDHGSPLTSTP